jgi:fructose/tagatose bisphosphate aldolase
LEHLDKLQQATGIPLVLHGGSGIKREYLLAAIKKGISKVNIGTEIRQPYEARLRETGKVGAAQEAVYERTIWLLKEYLGLAGSRKLVALN